MGETRPNTKRQSLFVSGISALLFSLTSVFGAPIASHGFERYEYRIDCSKSGGLAFSDPGPGPGQILSIDTTSVFARTIAVVNFGGLPDVHARINLNDCAFGGFGTSQVTFPITSGGREIPTFPVPNGSANPNSFVVYVAGTSPGYKIELELRLTNFNSVDKIQEFNRTRNANSMTIADLTAAGVIRLLESNLGAYRSSISQGFQTLDTAEKIQTVIDNTNANQLIEARNQAIAVVDALTELNAALLTINDLLATGVGRVVESNLSNYQTAFGALALGEADEEAEIQAIIDTVNAAVTESARLAALAAAIAAIEALTPDSSSTLTIPDLVAAGATSLVESNLNAYRSAFGLAISGAADSTPKIQAIVDSVNLSVASSRGSSFTSGPPSTLPTQDSPATISRRAVVRGFSASSPKLNRGLRLEIRKVLLESPETKSVTCRALFSAGATRGEIRLATSRAKAVCRFVARVEPNIEVRVKKRLLNPGQEAKASKVRLVLS